MNSEPWADRSAHRTAPSRSRARPSRWWSRSAACRCSAPARHRHRRLVAGARRAFDCDHWRLSSSRQPGNPVQEFGSAAVIGLGDWAINGLTALMALAAAMIFALLMRRLASSVDAMAGAALVFVPVVYIASASGMDYCWGLAFLLGATLAVVRGRHALAGLLLGHRDRNPHHRRRVCSAARPDGVRARTRFPAAPPARATDARHARGAGRDAVFPARLP